MTSYHEMAWALGIFSKKLAISSILLDMNYYWYIIKVILISSMHAGWAVDLDICG